MTIGSTTKLNVKQFNEYLEKLKSLRKDMVLNLAKKKSKTKDEKNWTQQN